MPEDDEKPEETTPAAITPEQFAELQKKYEEQAAHIKKLNEENARRRNEKKEVEKAADQEVSTLTTELRLRDAAGALKDAGAQGKSAKLLQMAGMLDSTDPAELEGSIDRFKELWPEFFKAPSEKDEDKEDPPPINRGRSKENGPPPKLTLEKAAKQLLDRRKPGYGRK